MRKSVCRKIIWCYFQEFSFISYMFDRRMVLVYIVAHSLFKSAPCLDRINQNVGTTRGRLICTRIFVTNLSIPLFFKRVS